MPVRRALIAVLVAFWPLQLCAETALEQHVSREESWKNQGLFLLPHRPNYIMPMSYNPHPNNAPYPAGSPPLEEIETKFQISLKIPVVEHISSYDIGAYLAYTQVSYWQTYNSEKSSLFRESDYEPEVFLQFNHSFPLGAVTNRYNRLGYDHQSNGQSDPNSRSWNRLYAEFVFDYDKAMLSFKPWYRINGPSDQDSNPDLWKYMGYGELRGAITFWKKNEASFMFRNNLDAHENKGAIELGWAFPLLRSMKGYIQYFNGYGESLIDYNVPANRISVGVSFTDWL